MTILEQLYYGELNPNMQNFEAGSKFGQTVENMVNAEEDLLKALAGEEKSLFSRFSRLSEEASMLSDVENFIIGFKLGLQIGIEAAKPGGIDFSDITE